MATQSWLLLLGSNLADSSRVDEALSRLSQLGTLTLLTPVARYPSHCGTDEYFNALARLDTASEGEPLRQQLHELEIALGRRRDVPGEVAIDVDILASYRDGRWHADSHAVGKGEFAHMPVTALLPLADIDEIVIDS